MSYIAKYMFDFGQLKSSFVCALEHWKPQTVSLLELPPEIRNMIYNMLVNETKYREPRLLDLGPGGFLSAPSLMMLHTCNQVQQELLPLYFSIITPHFRMPSPDSLRTRTLTHLLQSEVVAWLDRKGPDAADYFHAISLRSFDRPYIDCSVKVLRSMVVETKFYTNRRFEGHETSASHTLAEKITDSFKLSSTGVLACGISNLPKRP